MSDLQTTARRLVSALPEVRIVNSEGAIRYAIVLRVSDARIVVLDRGRDVAQWVQLRHVAKLEPLGEVPS